jgi:hypothetical protein
MQTRITVVGLIVLAACLLTVSARAQVLKNNFLIDDTAYFENTAKVIAPGTGCKDGRIVVVTGEPRPTAKIFHRPLYNNNGNIDFVSSTTELAFPTGSTKAIATDNQIIRLKDGSLLALKNGYVWDAITQNPPAWIDETITGGTNERKGLRNGVLLFRSLNCGKSWNLYSTIDNGTFLQGKYGVPRPASDVDGDGKLEADVPPSEQGKHPDGSLMWYVGGIDRTEIYACPFTGNVYLTGYVVSGPYKSINKLKTCVLLYSKDNAKTWEAVKEDLPVGAPIVMTSTPNGRLFLFMAKGSQPTVYFSTSPLKPKEKPVMSPGYPVNYVENGTKIPNATVQPSNPKDKKTWIVDMTLKVNHPSISRNSTTTTSNKIRAAYHSLNSNGMQETRVISIDVQNPDKAPVVKPVKVVEADNPKDYSVLYFNFIDPDYIDTPGSFSSNTSVAYWIEVPRVAIAQKKYAIRYMVFEGDYNGSCPDYLSVKDGKPRNWSKRSDIGDYMTGGFFWKDNKLNYLAQWVEPDGIKANVVMLPYNPIRGKLLTQKDAGAVNEADDRFGWSVATGDFNKDGFKDLAIGAPGETPPNEPKSGVIFIFSGSAVGLSKGKVFTQNDARASNDPGDLFGYSLATGDFNKDGFDDLAVGAPGETPPNEPKSGAIMVFSGSAAGLSKGKVLTQKNAKASDDPDDQFGYSLAAGDFNKDGFDDLAVGAPGETPPNEPKSGALMVFSGSAAGLSKGEVLTQKNAKASNDPDDQFGYSLAAGDFNKDGFNDLAVGAPGETPPNEPKSGAIMVFSGSPAGLSKGKVFTQKNVGASNDPGDRFGGSLAVGDFNKDGFKDLAIGAPGETPPNDPKSGAVMILSGSTVGLAKGRVITGKELACYETNRKGDLFGQSLAVGDFDKDGFDDLAVGASGKAPGDDHKSGVVFIFPGSGEGLSEGESYNQSYLGLGAEEDGDAFGWSLAAGDFDKDGHDDLAIGAPGEAPHPEPKAGVVFIMRGKELIIKRKPTN